ncbi:tetratricopeptide repeat protein [Streptomyces sp. NPDC004609]|uniref:tetratricopeptide repeat protein n=1 Tax=Streptomyces sp. NPDC004609 TaxID=3364704 RepID=UPI0036AFE3D7
MAASSADGADSSLYERASDLHRRGRPEEALPLLEELLREEPDDVAGRYAFGICLTDTGRTAEAQVQFRRVLDHDPRHYQAAYRLGRLLQADADPAGAAEAYRKVLAVAPDFRDTAARLRACQDPAGATTHVAPPPPGGPPVVGRALTPGPPTLRSQSEAHRVADRGRPGMSVRLKARHLLIVIGKRFLVAAVLTLAVPLLGRGSLMGPSAFLVLGALVAWVFFLSSLVLLLVRPRTDGADFYEYGVDVKSGFVRRRVQFIWYYQIVESPGYARTLGTYLTNTASLTLRYNEAGASSTRTVELTGIGTPKQVQEIGRYVESRTFPERHVVRGPWT